MKSPLVPIALFVGLVASAAAALPLAGTAFLSLSLFGAMVSLAGLAWWVIAVAMPTDPPGRLHPAAEGWADGWESFERDFWAHVARVDARRD